MDSTQNMLEKIIKRKKHFSDEETTVLIRVWGDEKINKMFSTSSKHTAIYNKISAEMEKYNYYRSGEEIKNKINNLKSEYKKRRPKSGEQAPEWQFYYDLNHILGTKDKYIAELGDESIPPENIQQGSSSSFTKLHSTDGIDPDSFYFEEEYLLPDEIENIPCSEPSHPTKKRKKMNAETSLTELLSMSRENNLALQELVVIKKKREKREEEEDKRSELLTNSLIKYFNSNTEKNNILLRNSTPDYHSESD